MQTKIQSISKTKTLDYSELSVNHFWQKRKNMPKSSLKNNAAQLIHALQSATDSVICIQTEALTDAKLIEVIFEAAKRNRIYLLVNEKKEALLTLTGSSLIRFDLKNIGSTMLINPNTNDAKGFIFNGQLTEQSFAYPQNVLLDLDKEQVKTLFQHFCYHFWNTAPFEILEKAQKVADSPIDIYPCTQNFCDADFVKNKLTENVNASNISISAIRNGVLLNIEAVKNAKIITSLTGNNLDLLKQIKANDNEVFALSGTNPLHLIGNWFIPKTTITNDALFYALPLNKAQKETIEEHFSMLKDSATYEYFTQKSRKALLNETFCFAEKISEEITITAQENMQAANCSANELLPKDDFEKQEPAFNDNGKSVSITFAWKNEPYYVPKTAKVHKLYKDWEDFTKKTHTFIAKIEAKIAEGEKRESSISAALQRFFLGKKTIFRNLRDQITDVKDLPFSAIEQAETKKNVAKLNEIYAQVMGEMTEIETEDKKAKIDEEIVILKVKKAEKESQILEHEQNMKQKEAEAEVKYAEFYAKYDTNKVNFTKFKSELEQKAGKKNKAKNPEEAADAQAILDEWSTLQNADFTGKMKEEYAKMKKEMERIENEISRKEKEKTTINLTEKKEDESSLTLITEKNKAQNNPLTHENSLQNPNLLPLPKVGELYEAGNQSYLAIENWEEYDLGKVEAKRLDAKLCTLDEK